MSTYRFRGSREARAIHRRLERRRGFVVEPLEGRQMLSTFTVTNINDSGSGSLRQAIIGSNVATGPNIISFNIPGTGVQTIKPLSALPTVTKPVTIDGTTEPNSDGQPVIQLDGTNAGSSAVGLYLNTAASGSTIQGLAITEFAAGGIILDGASHVTLAGDDLGLESLSVPMVARGNGIAGVELENGASYDLLIGDVISGQNGDGVLITGSGTMANTVQGSLIGSDPAGVYSLANVVGIVILDGASDNTIGGATPGTRDVISGNETLGVILSGAGTDGNVVEGDYIGTNVAANYPLPNGQGGIEIAFGASGNTIGGTLAGARDIIAGNGSSLLGPGVEINGAGTASNVVEGDWIGVDVTGLNALPNGQDGVLIVGGPTNNTIGGTVAGAGDVISGNARNGVALSGQGTMGNLIEGDTIGLAAIPAYIDNLYPVPNGLNGVIIENGASGNTVGGMTAAAADTISGNMAGGPSSDGVEITDPGTGANVVEGDFIGTDMFGNNAVPNSGNGVLIAAGATSNTIGGTSVGARDIISGNGYSGVAIEGTGTSGNFVEGDYIGTSGDGNDFIVLQHGNLFGVAITTGASDNTIGGTTPGAGNVISFNQTGGANSNGVYIVGTGTTGNVVEGDLIGTNAAGTFASGNSGNGVLIAGGAAGNTIGGTTPAARDVISGNTYSGVAIEGAGTTGNVVEGDDIGLNAAGTGLVNYYIGTGTSRTIAAGSGFYGVAITTGASGNTVGGTTAGAANDIVGLAGIGVLISGAGTSNNVLEGDFIGTDPAGATAVGSLSYDVLINGGATTNTIGGPTAGARDVISGNAVYRVFISDQGTSSNVVEGDDIGTNAAGNGLVGTGSYGVYVGGAATLNVIGGQTAAQGNLIAGNTVDPPGGYADGIEITGPGTEFNLVEGDTIVTNVVGVSLAGGASYNLVESSVISSNDDGVILSGAGTTGNQVVADHIGTDATGTIGEGNGYYGIIVASTYGNLINGDTIAYSGVYGIVIGAGDGDSIVYGAITFIGNQRGNFVSE